MLRILNKQTHLVNMPKVEFYFDFENDLKIIKKTFPLFRDVFGAKFNLLLREYYPDCAKKTSREMVQYFKRNEKEIMPKIKKEAKFLETRWKRINDGFFSQIVDITGLKWKYKKYRCQISSSYIVGGGYEKPNTIFVFPPARHTDALIVIAHELVHLHLFDIFGRMGVDTDKADKKLWNLSEALVNLVLEKVRIKGFNYTGSICPQHRILYKELKSLWRGNFKEFVLMALTDLKSSKHLYTKIK